MIRQHSDMHRKMRSRNLALALTLAAFVIVVAVATYIKMGGGS